MRGRAATALFWACAPVLVLGPAWVRGGLGVPGARRSDLWNSLWTLWHAWRAPFGHTSWLDHPDGGVLPLADPVNALLVGPMLPLVGAAIGWSVLVWLHLSLAGAATAALARQVGATRFGAMAAGVSFLVAPVGISGIHNGTSEAVGLGWLPLALFMVGWAGAREDRRSVLIAALVLALAGLSSWYLAVCAWAGALLLGLRTGQARRVLVVVALASLVVLPWAVWVQGAATDADNLVGIKDPGELSLVRRTIGAVDPRVYLVPGDFRSPDFRRISRYGEDFIHCTYLGWVWLLTGGVTLVRQRRWRWLALGLGATVLAMGPVLVADGSPVLLEGNLGIGLPYFLLERLPGFGSLSLVYRFAALASLALAVGVGLWASTPRRALVVAVLGALEIALFSPVAGLPALSHPPSGEAFAALEGEGAVMNFPVVGGRPYLYEATLHGRPLASTLNFPTNKAAEKVWGALRDQDAQRATTIARARGVRFLVLHDDDEAEPGAYAGAAAFARRSFPVVASQPGLEVVALW